MSLILQTLLCSEKVRRTNLTASSKHLREFTPILHKRVYETFKYLHLDHLHLDKTKKETNE